MTNVIDFLEKMGQNAQWNHASQEEIQLALASAEITPELQAAIVAGDQLSLQALLGLTPLCGMYMPGKEDEDTEEVPPGEEDDKPEQSLSRLQTPAG